MVKLIESLRWMSYKKELVYIVTPCIPYISTKASEDKSVWYKCNKRIVVNFDTKFEYHVTEDTELEIVITLLGFGIVLERQTKYYY
jgi:hypothetical protein